jgi:hypothetical protein
LNFNYAEVTPMMNKTEVVVPAMPGVGPATGEKLTRPGTLAQAAGSDSQEVAELKRVNQAMGVALRDVMSIGEGSSMVTQLMLGKGHEEVVGIITAGGALPSEAK